MRNYNWYNYNLKRNKEAIKIYNRIRRSKINFLESGVYKNIRDIYALSILICKTKNTRIKILDYGGNLMSHVNLINKIDTKNIEISIFNPFIKKFINKTSIKIKFFKKMKGKILKKKFDLVYFGSVLQYINSLKNLEGKKNITNARVVLITHTPISHRKKRFFLKQSNAKDLFQKIHTLSDINNDLLRKKFTILFKSINENKYAGLKKKPENVFSTNLIMKKK